MKSSTLVHNDECTIYGLHLIAALYMSFVSVRFSPLEVDMWVGGDILIQNTENKQ